MMHRARDGRTEPAEDRAFRTLMAEGFAGGGFPGPGDWRDQLNQAWPFVRLRETLELRLADGPPYASIPCAPAFWTGLVYHRPSRLAALGLLEGRTVAEHLRTVEDVAARGLAARHGEDRVADLAAELLRLAEEGLRARVAAGLERPDVLRHLEPLHEVIETGETFAHHQLRRWEKEFSRGPRAFVKAYRIS